MKKHWRYVPLKLRAAASAVLIRERPLNNVKFHDVWSNICKEVGAAPLNELLDVNGGDIQYGKDKSNPLYGWDNECGHAEAKVKPFKASKHLVSNTEFLEFVETNGYHTRSYWDDEGWHWVQYAKAEHPVYWIKDAGQYKYRSMLEAIDMPWNWPADLNYLERLCWTNQLRGMSPLSPDGSSPRSL